MLDVRARVVRSRPTHTRPARGLLLPAPGTGFADAPGFTLLEIAIVLFIMGLMMAVAIPYFGSVTGAQLKSQARQLAGRATYLYEEAAVHKVVLRLTFNLDLNSYYVSRLDPYQPQAVFVPELDPLMGRVVMPAGVRIRDVTVAGLGTFTRGTVSGHFYPTGWADAAVIHLVDSRGAVFTLGINPLTGRVSIAAGDRSEKQMAVTGQ